MITQRGVRFTNTAGVTLAGRLTLPPAPVAFGVYAHCFTCGKDLKFANRLARRLAEHDLALLRFDFTGIGESGGDFAETNFSTNIADLADAIDYLASEHAAPGFLMGHSLGGAAAIAVAADRPEVRSLVLLNAPSDTRHLRGNLAALDPGLETSDAGEVTLGGRRWAITPQFLADLTTHDVVAAAARLQAATLLCHSQYDVTVPPVAADRLAAAISAPCGRLPLADDHLLGRREETTTFVADAAAGWVKMWG